MKIPDRNRLLLAFVGLFICLAIFILALEILNFNKIIHGTKIAGYKAGGLTTEEAHGLLKDRLNSWLKQNIILTYQSQQFSATPEELGIKIDTEKTIALAYNRGRGKNIASGLFEQALTLLPIEQNTIVPVYNLDQDAFDKFTQEKFAGIENPAIFASLAYNKKTKDWDITPAKEGYVFDREKLSQDLEDRLAKLNASPIQLILIKDLPEVLEDETGKAKEMANSILANAPYYLKFAVDDQSEKEKKWTLDRVTLLDWLDFAPTPPSQGGEDGGLILGTTLNQEKVENILMTFSPSINQEPVNAQLKFQDGKVTTFSLPQEGIRLDVEQSAKKITAAITRKDKFEPNKALAEKNIELIVERKQPLICSENIEKLGLTSLIGVGESNFAGSPNNRKHNIKVGAAKFNGVLIRPGQEFSFNEILGEVDAKQGYLPELVIKRGKTVPEYGGGICQVSTTAFRAAINSGLKITERYPHAYPVKYYAPQGFDATIYPPHPDLRFINDTPNNLLVQTKIEGNKITFEFYGTADGRKTEVKGPYILSSNPDGSMKTILYQEVWRNGELIREDKFSSSYRSPALYPTIRNPLE